MVNLLPITGIPPWVYPIFLPPRIFNPHIPIYLLRLVNHLFTFGVPRYYIPFTMVHLTYLLQFTYSDSVNEANTFPLPLPSDYHVITLGVPRYTFSLSLVYPVANPHFSTHIAIYLLRFSSGRTHISFTSAIGLPRNYIRCTMVNLLPITGIPPWVTPFFFPPHFHPAHTNLLTQIG